MCWAAAIPAIMQGGQMALGQSQSNQQVAAQNDALRKQAIQQVSEMNYNDANLKMQLADTKGALVQQKTQDNMDYIRNLGTLKAAIGESGIEGNSMKRIQQVSSGDFVRQEQGLNDNYERDYAKIFGDRVSNIEGSKNTIEGYQAKEGKVRGVLEQVIDPLNLGIGKLVAKNKYVGVATPLFQKKFNKAVDKGNAKANNKL